MECEQNPVVVITRWKKCVQCIYASGHEFEQFRALKLSNQQKRIIVMRRYVVHPFRELNLCCGQHSWHVEFLDECSKELVAFLGPGITSQNWAILRLKPRFLERKRYLRAWSWNIFQKIFKFIIVLLYREIRIFLVLISRDYNSNVKLNFQRFQAFKMSKRSKSYPQVIHDFLRYKKSYREVHKHHF